MNNLNQISQQFHERAKSKGFWDKKPEKGTLLMLVTSELSEALEADRKNKYANIVEFKQNLIKLEKAVVDENEPFKQSFEDFIKDTFEDEIADAFIRLFDICGFFKIDIDNHIALKMKYNALRPHKHGKSY